MGRSPSCRQSPQESAIDTPADPPTARDLGGLVGRLRRPARPIERWLIAGLILWLLVGPRIELVASVRIEDLVFALLAVLCLVHVRPLQRPTGPTVGVVVVVGAGLVSAGVAIARGAVAPIPAVLFAIRPIEYWIAFPAIVILLAGGSAEWQRRFDRLLAVVTVLQTAFAVLQYYFDVPIGFSHASYTRAAGLTVGPYELGAIAAALLVYWVAGGRWILASVSAIALATSISRVSILGAGSALAVLAVAWAVRRARGHARWRSSGTGGGARRPARALVALQAMVVAVAVVVVAFTLGLVHLPATSARPESAASPSASSSSGRVSAPDLSAPVATGVPTDGSSGQPDPPSPQPVTTAAPPDSIAERLATTSILGSWRVSSSLAAGVPPVYTSAQYADVAYTRLHEFVNFEDASTDGAEASNVVRFFRWHLILNTIDQPVEVVLGLGPSFVGPSVDGSYLRMYAEGGVLGVLAWLTLIVFWFRRVPLWMVAVTISVLVGAMFIDIVYAERPMVLFWSLLAVAFTRHQSERPAGPATPVS